MWWSRQRERVDAVVDQRLWHSETGDIPAEEEILCRYRCEVTTAAEAPRSGWVYATQRGLRTYGSRFEPLSVMTWAEIDYLDLQLAPTTSVFTVRPTGSDLVTTFSLQKRSDVAELAWFLATRGAAEHAALGPALARMLPD